MGAMKKKVFVWGLLIFAASNILLAEEVDTVGSSSISFITPVYDLTAEGGTNYQDYTSGERAKIIGLNFLFGAGSYSAGHVAHGVALTLLEAGGIVFVALPFVLGMEIGLSDKGRQNVSNPSSGSSGNDYYNDNLTPESNAAIWLWVGGGMLLITDVVLNIMWPLKYHRPQQETAMLTDLRNWSVALVPGNMGPRTQISFTAHFDW
jgi:multisubunit Na+/H+ antiporter MnhB subunit